MSINVPLAAKTVLTILTEDQGRSWNQKQLATAVGNRINQANIRPIEFAILSLHAAGVIAGEMSRSRSTPTLRWIQWKNPTGDDGTMSEVEAEALRNQVNEYRRLAEEAARKVLEADARVKAAKEQADATKSQERVVQVQLKSGTKVVKNTKGLFHEKFEKLLKLAEARMNIFIYGPTGCGKSHVCAQLAEALNLSFSFVSCTAGMSEGILGGRLLPVGKSGTFEYVISEFIKAYETGGVFLLDEIDAADPNVLLLVNAALANGRVAVPNRPKKPYAERHADFICIAAANTVGTGADRLYSGRNKLDAATLDRFQIGKVVMDYDERVEVILCPDNELRTRLLQYRRAIMAHRLERAMSTRFMRDAHVMKSDYGWTMDDINAAFFSGWREDEVNKVQSFRD